jgi:Family of unknown function (DUF6338)
MPTTLTAVVILVAFLMPGFIASRALSFVYPSSETGETRAVLTAITLSSFNYAILSWIIILAWWQSWYKSVEFLAAFVFFALFVSPVIIALLFGKVNDSDWGRRMRQKFGVMHPIPKAWDHFFRRRVPCWVIATMKDGRVIGGLYGPNSFASSFPAQEDLYIEKVCTMSADGKMEGVIAQSVGAIIRMENVALLEFFEIG